MSDLSMRARLGLDNASFGPAIKATQADLDQTKEKARALAAAVALLEREMGSGKGTAAQIAQHRQLRAELVQTEQVARKTAQQLARIEGGAPALRSMPTASRPQAAVRMERSPVEETAAGAHGGSNAMRNAELMHSGRAALDMMDAGMSPFQAFMAEAPRLFQAFASSLGGVLVPLGALIGGGAFIKWLHDADTEAKALRQETAAIGSNLGSLAGANAKELEMTLAEAAGQMHKVRDANDSKGNQLVNMLTGGGVHDDDVRAALNQQQRVQDRMQDAQERDGSFARRSFEGDAGVEADRIRLEYAQKRDEIVKKASVDDLTNTTRALALAREERDLRLDMLARTQAFQQNELSLESQLLAIRRYGKSVASENARARMEKAKADLDAGPQTGPEHDAAVTKYLGAQTDHQEAVRRQAEDDAAQDLRKRNADLRGSADDVAYQQATNSRDAIQNKLDDPATKPDDVKRLQADLAEAKERLAALAKGTNEKGIEIQKLGIHTDAGRGPQAELDSADKLLGVIEQQRRLNKEKNGDDALVNAQLNDQAAELLRHKSDILFSEQQTLAAAREQTKEMQLHLAGQDSAAKIKGIRASYEERIAVAVRDGKNDLATELQTQKELAVQAAKLAEFRKTPAQRSQETLQGQKDQQDLRAMNSHAKSELENARQNYEDQNRANLPLDPVARAAAIAAAVPDKDGVLKSNPYDDSTKAAEAVSNATDAAFNSRFHPGNGNGYQADDVLPLPNIDLPADYGVPFPEMPAPSIDSSSQASNDYNGPSADEIGSAVAANLVPYVIT